ncbi:MAG: hypothetical protein LBC27_00025 [Spirochaetaceae bacterium]|jgi:hypothetical protein|nr:hypothetical protein [Spirochaetaceae bacterium]
MKRIALLLAISALTTGFAFTQDGTRGPGDNVRQRSARFDGNRVEDITLNGKLEWLNGRIGLKANGKTYFISGIQPVLGFVDGLKEGAQVTLAGRVYTVPYIEEYGFFHAEKLTFNGKDYILIGEGNRFKGERHGGMGPDGRRAGEIPQPRR